MIYLFEGFVGFIVLDFNYFFTEVDEERNGERELRRFLTTKSLKVSKQQK